jgi:hypothetical protein
VNRGRGLFHFSFSFRFLSYFAFNIGIDELNARGSVDVFVPR